MGPEQARGASYPGPASVKLSAEKAAFSGRQKVQVIHAAVNLDAKMHEAEDICKYILQLYAFIFQTDASIRLRSVHNP